VVPESLSGVVLCAEVQAWLGRAVCWLAGRCVLACLVSGHGVGKWWFVSYDRAYLMSVAIMLNSLALFRYVLIAFAMMYGRLLMRWIDVRL